MIYKVLGRVFFWVTWPLIWLYAPLRVRARVLVVFQDEYLVVKACFGSGAWQLPGGGIARGESPAQTAQRELLEEVGINLNVRALELIVERRVFKETGL